MRFLLVKINLYFQLNNLQVHWFFLRVFRGVNPPIAIIITKINAVTGKRYGLLWSFFIHKDKNPILGMTIGFCLIVIALPAIPRQAESYLE